MGDLKWRTIIQGGLVEDLVSEGDHNSPKDEEIDSEKPIRFDVIIKRNEKKEHLAFEIAMLSENDFYSFMKNYSYIKSKIERVIDNVEKEIEELKNKIIKPDETNEESDNKENSEKEKEIRERVWSELSEYEQFKDSFTDVIVKYSKCLNPEIVNSEELINIMNVEFKDEITEKDYFVLFRHLINNSHPIIKSYLKFEDLDRKTSRRENNKYKKMLKQVDNDFMKGNITYKQYLEKQTELSYNFSRTKRLEDFFKQTVLDLFTSFDIQYIKKLCKDIINENIKNVLKSIRIDLILPVFYKVIWYNEYLVKKNLQKTMKKIMNRTDQRLRLTSLSEKNLGTIRTGVNAYPELKYSEN